MSEQHQPLSDNEIATWHAFKRAGGVVFGLVARDVSAATGLSAGDFGVLSRLVDLGGGKLRQVDLAQSMEWDKARLSHHLTRMQGRKLIARREVSAKEVFVEITSRGRSALDEARPVHAAAIRRHLLDRLRKKEIAVFSRLLIRLSIPPD